VAAKTQLRLPGAVALPTERIEGRVLLIRGEKVLLDTHLAELYGVPTKALNQAVQRNLARFPQDFMFQLTARENEVLLQSQFVTSDATAEVSEGPSGKNLRSQNVTAKTGRGGRRTLPYAFTEQGVAMLSGVLRSPRAIAVNVEIMRAFVRLRQMIATHADLARKLATLEKKYDQQFKAIFEAIRELMTPVEEEEAPSREMGFHSALAEKSARKN
jgi:ORF6N domain-containing protein